MKQILFYDIRGDSKELHAGIMLDNKNVICGCCGRKFKDSKRNKTWKLYKKYSEWKDIQYPICENDPDLEKLVGDK